MTQSMNHPPDEITPQELHEWLTRQETPIVLLDVREPVEHDYCHLAGARLIPLAELPFRTSELNSDDPLVVYCHHGIRSLQAVRYLRSHGFAQARSLQGGIDLWSCLIDPSVPRY